MTIALTITEAARASLAADLARSTLPNPVATVMWTEGGMDGFKPTPAEWCVAFYDASDVSAGSIEIIDGIRFVFVRGPISKQLSGRTLDVEKRNYVVI